jgi:histidine ammonia-lyase
VSLVAENRRLAMPASVDSIPTSGMQEDHVSLGWSAGIKLRRALRNLATVVAIEVLVAAAGIEQRLDAIEALGQGRLAPSARIAAVLERVRVDVDAMPRDRFLAEDLAAMTALVTSGAVLEAADLPEEA